MQQEAVGGLAVVEEGRLVGMVSMRDLVALAAWPPGQPART
jgi:CBS domain-containing protein